MIVPSSNFLLISRIDPTSFFEEAGDLLLTPARILFGGRRALVLSDKSIHISKPEAEEISSNPWVRVALKVALLIALPIAPIGAVVKLLSLKDQNYRTFCIAKLPSHSTCHPKLFEMFRHVHFTSHFTHETWVSLVFEPLKLSECSCSVTHAFHRLKSPRRNNFENAIVQRLADYRPDKNLPLQLLSMGSGGLMSDFLTLEKLVLAGFKKISIDCVDPMGIDDERIKRIRDFFSDYKAVSIEVKAYKTIDEAPIKSAGYAAVVAADYDVLCGWGPQERLVSAGDLMKAYQRLNPEGFLGLGFSDEDTLFGPRMLPIKLTPAPSLIHNLAYDLILEIPQKEELTISLPHAHFAAASHLFMFSLALAVQNSPALYRKISVAFTNSVDQEQVEDFQTMMRAMFPHTHIDVGFLNEENPKSDLLFTGSLEAKFKSKQYLSFLHEKSKAYILYPEGSISRQNGCLEGQRTSIL